MHDADLASVLCETTVEMLARKRATHATDPIRTLGPPVQQIKTYFRSLNLVATAFAAGDPAYDACRVAGHNRPGRHILGDHRARAYCGALPHSHAPYIKQKH